MLPKSTAYIHTGTLFIQNLRHSTHGKENVFIVDKYDTTKETEV